MNNILKRNKKLEKYNKIEDKQKTVFLRSLSALQSYRIFNELNSFAGFLGIKKDESLHKAKLLNLIKIHRLFNKVK
jgi:hypothetical protein